MHQDSCELVNNTKHTHSAVITIQLNMQVTRLILKIKNNILVLILLYLPKYTCTSISKLLTSSLMRSVLRRSFPWGANMSSTYFSYTLNSSPCRQKISILGWKILCVKRVKNWLDFNLTVTVSLCQTVSI